MFSGASNRLWTRDTSRYCTLENFSGELGFGVWDGAHWLVVMKKVSAECLAGRKNPGLTDFDPASPGFAPKQQTRTWGTLFTSPPIPLCTSPAILFTSGSFREKRYCDRNVRDYREFAVKLKYLLRNRVKRGLVARPEEWKWSGDRHYALGERNVVEIESAWAARDREPPIDCVEQSRSLIPGWRSFVLEVVEYAFEWFAEHSGDPECGLQ
jgi:hypothetical protein